MGFFEDAISKTKEVFDVVCQKTGEIVTTEKQKISIASLKSKREKDYAALGKIYFEIEQILGKREFIENKLLEATSPTNGDR